MPEANVPVKVKTIASAASPLALCIKKYTAITALIAAWSPNMTAGMYRSFFISVL